MTGGRGPSQVGLREWMEASDTRLSSEHDGDDAGSFARCIAVQLGTDIRDVSATRLNGILRVQIGNRSDHWRDARQIPVAVEP
jgi:hypothetical protein